MSRAVHARPRNAVRSSFSLGGNPGILRSRRFAQIHLTEVTKSHFKLVNHLYKPNISMSEELEPLKVLPQPLLLDSVRFVGSNKTFASLPTSTTPEQTSPASVKITVPWSSYTGRRGRFVNVSAEIIDLSAFLRLIFPAERIKRNHYDYRPRQFSDTVRRFPTICTDPSFVFASSRASVEHS
jgi:hypothetical protein